MMRQSQMQSAKDPSCFEEGKNLFASISYKQQIELYDDSTYA